MKFQGTDTDKKKEKKTGVFAIIWSPRIFTTFCSGNYTGLPYSDVLRAVMQFYSSQAASFFHGGGSNASRWMSLKIRCQVRRWVQKEACQVELRFESILWTRFCSKWIQIRFETDRLRTGSEAVTNQRSNRTMQKVGGFNKSLFSSEK